MATLFVRHTVNDYAQWRAVYDSFADTQKELGVTEEHVYQGVDNPNDVTATHEFDTVEAAQAFLASDPLHEAMGKAGVVGEPTFWITEEAE